MKHLFRILLLTFSFCIYGNLAFSQSSSAFYDAVKLSDAVESNNETQFYKVVATYTGLPYRSEMDKKAIDAKLQQAGNTVLLEEKVFCRHKYLPQQDFRRQKFCGPPEGRSDYGRCNDKTQNGTTSFFCA